MEQQIILFVWTVGYVKRNGGKIDKKDQLKPN